MSVAIPRFSDLDRITQSILRAAWAAEAAKKAIATPARPVVVGAPR
ncbi:MAG TPA: hypothetical protein VIK31_11795 [Propionibacteriaceae bacterium]|jgi:hypothetical protein